MWFSLWMVIFVRTEGNVCFVVFHRETNASTGTSSPLPVRRTAHRMFVCYERLSSFPRKPQWVCCSRLLSKTCSRGLRWLQRGTCLWGAIHWPGWGIIIFKSLWKMSNFDYPQFYKEMMNCDTLCCLRLRWSWRTWLPLAAMSESSLPPLLTSPLASVSSFLSLI